MLLKFQHNHKSRHIKLQCLTFQVVLPTDPLPPPANRFNSVIEKIERIYKVSLRFMYTFCHGRVRGGISKHIFLLLVSQIRSFFMDVGGADLL